MNSKSNLSKRRFFEYKNEDFKMDSLIIDLQKDIIENKDIRSILNKALMISNELELKEFNEWVNLELNGYDNLDKLPPYRILECELRCDKIENNWGKPIITSNVPVEGLPHKWNEKYREVFIYQSVLELIHLCEVDHEIVRFKLNFEIESILKKHINNTTEIYRACPIFQLKAIIDHVKNEILNWCSELKKNDIVGESYYFTDKERQVAKTINIISPIIHIENTNIQINNENILINLKKMRDILNKNDVDEEFYNVIINNIDIIEEELGNDKPNINVMKKSIQVMKDFLNQVATTAVASLLLEHINIIANILLSTQLPM